MQHKNGKKIGYVRVGSFDQNPERQLEGIELDRKFIDKASGKSKERPKLEEMMSYIREGDVLIVHSMDRLGTTTCIYKTVLRAFKIWGVISKAL